MAHTKAAGTKARQGGLVRGKRRGVKVYSGQIVTCGSIIVRQLGTKFHPGKNTKIARDCSIYATVNGKVSYRRGTGDRRNRKFIDVMPIAEKTAE